MTSIAQTSALPVRARGRSAAKQAAGLWLEVGEAIRYQGLGAGYVVAHEMRDFRGSPCTFAVIEFPHREMTAQIPLGQDGMVHKLRPVISGVVAKRLLKVIGEPAQKMGRTWFDRSEVGSQILRDGTPEDWAGLLRDYAGSHSPDYTDSHSKGMMITPSDMDLVNEALDLLSAEYACAVDLVFDEAYDLVHGAYNRAAQKSRAA